MGLPVAPFEIKVGDRLPAISCQLVDASGAPVNAANASQPGLTGASYVKFAMRPSGVATQLLSNFALITDATNAIVEYDWGINETAGSVAATAAVNYYQGEFEAMFPASRTLTFPNQGYIPIVFLADII